ncbi:MAG: hypothetical protein ACPIA1_00180 [Flavobacteriaceae bacterium]
MKTKNYSILAFMALIFVASCGKDDDGGGTIIIDQNPSEDVFIEVDPNLNDGEITFEETGPSFALENKQPEDRSQGNWGRFGGNEANELFLSLEYADNPSVDDVNGSAKVVKVTEPVGVQSWAGFYFMLSEKLVFPAGKEAISFQFYSPGPGHTVMLKLEDELANETEGKKSTGDQFAVTTGTGWETLVVNTPELEGRDGIYNTMTFIMGYGKNNETETVYYFDNINFAEPAEIVVPADPTSAPAAPAYSQSEVISIFSDAFTSVEGLNLNPNWGQSTAVTTETIADNTVLKYASLNYQGTTVSPTLDLSGKSKLHIDYFTGNATSLKFFLISPDNDDDDEAAQEIGYDIDVTSAPGTWNSVDIDLSYFADVVDLSEVFQMKVEGNGDVYFDNIFFYGGGAQSGTNYSATYTGGFGDATVTGNTFNFPTGAQAWAGFANESPSTVSFPYGGKITFTGATAGTNVDLNFKFERLGFNAEGNGAADTEPNFATQNITVSGTEEKQYTLYFGPQDAANTYASHLLYLVTQDAEVTLTDIVVTSFDAVPSGTNYAGTYTGGFGDATVTGSTFNFPTGAQAWAGFANESPSTVSFPKGGKITFNGATAGTDVVLNFKFERLGFNAEGNGAADTEPSFSTQNITVSGTEATQYTLYFTNQDEANTYASHLLYLVTQDAEVTLTDIVVTSFE